MERSASQSGRFSPGTRAPVSTEPTWWGWQEIFLPFPRFEHAPKLTAESLFWDTLSVAQIRTVSNSGKHEDGSGCPAVRADTTGRQPRKTSPKSGSPTPDTNTKRHQALDRYARLARARNACKHVQIAHSEVQTYIECIHEAQTNFRSKFPTPKQNKSYQ